MSPHLPQRVGGDEATSLPDAANLRDLKEEGARPDIEAPESLPQEAQAASSLR